MQSKYKTPQRGVFWVIDDRLFAYPFIEGIYPEGVAKSGNTYNHKMLWAVLNISSKPFDYYPRGRIDVSAGGRVKVYLSPHVNQEKWIPEIRTAFNLGDINVRIHEDYSVHYRCHLDVD